MPEYSFANPWEMPGKFLKGNLHTHTTKSDGKEDPSERAARYRERGYDFLAITDHNRITRADEIAAPDGLALIQGVELHPANPYKGEDYHLVALNVSRDIPAAGLAHPQEALDAVAEQGGIAFFAHPYWCKQTWTEIAPLQGFFGVEVYNATCQRIGRGDSTAQWDEYLCRVALCGALATDDCHRPGTDGVDTYLAWVMVKAERNAPDAILDALKQGAYYASCGPAIEDLKVEPTERAGSKTVRLSVRTSPAAYIAFVSDIGGGYAGSCGGDGAKEVAAAEYVANPGARYVRVEVTDARGRKAWTNPVPVAPPKPGGGSPATVAGMPLVAPWARI